MRQPLHLLPTQGFQKGSTGLSKKRSMHCMWTGIFLDHHNHITYYINAHSFSKTVVQAIQYKPLTFIL